MRSDHTAINIVLFVTSFSHYRERERDREMERQSWSLTLLTQISLCVALFIALNIGGNSERASSDDINIARLESKKGRRPVSDLYFMSVRGGHRPLTQQTHLLQQMDKVAKLCDVKFVVNISELGDDDQLTQNATSQFSSLKVPWYNTNASQGSKARYFLKQIPLRHDQNLDIIVLDTGALQVLDVNGTVKQLSWLTKMLENTDSKWRIAIGFHPLVLCKQNEEEKVTQVFEPLRNIFLKFKVNAYLSKQGCADLYTRKAGMAYIGNPGPYVEESHKAISSVESSSLSRDLHHGFFLHRVSPLEIVSYFINAKSEVEFRFILHQHGKESM